jgi:hypothetical protein
MFLFRHAAMVVAQIRAWQGTLVTAGAALLRCRGRLIVGGLEKMFNMGTQASDRITGFKGYVTGRCEYITGCTQFLLQPPLDKNGKFVEARWVDEDRLVAADGPLVELKIEKAGFDVPAPVR